jgi:hypothetical protein
MSYFNGLREEELRLQGCRFVTPTDTTPEHEIDESLNVAADAIDRAIALFDTNDVETTAMLYQAITLISRIQRRLS